MFNSVNKTILIGRLTKDVETKYSPSGTQISTSGLVTWEHRKVEGKWKEHNTFHNLVAFSKVAEIFQKCSKGDLVYIEAKFQQNNYEQDGVQKSSHNFLIEEIQVINKKDEKQVSKKENHEIDDEIPF